MNFISDSFSIDLCHSLMTGWSPMFSPSPDLIFRVDESPLAPCTKYAVKVESNQSISGLVDARLGAVYDSLQSLAQRLNETTSGRVVMTELHLHDGVLMSQYQLFELRGTLSNNLEECVRIVILAVLTTTFRIVGTRIRYRHAADRLRELCLAIEASTPQLRELMFWMLMIGAIAFFDYDEPWLRRKWESDVHPITKNSSWKDARKRLEGFIWINSYLDEPGKLIFDQMRRSSAHETIPHSKLSHSS